MGYAKSISVDGDVAYLAAGSDLRIVDFSNPAAPFESGSFETLYPINSVFVSGGLAFVAGKGVVPGSEPGQLSPGTIIVDVTDPAAPVLAAPSEAGVLIGPEDNVFVYGGLAFIGRRDDIRIVDGTRS